MAVCEISIGMSDVISALAFLVSALSALYARWSWEESKKANQISTVERKREIYEAFFDLKMHMLKMAAGAELGEVVKFYYHYRNAKLYLPKNLSEKVSKYYEICFFIADCKRMNEGSISKVFEQCEQKLELEQKLAAEIEESLTEIINNAMA